MLNILAQSFMTASRVNTPKVTDVPKPGLSRKQRWTAPAHWRMRPERLVDLDKL